MKTFPSTLNYITFTHPCEERMPWENPYYVQTFKMGISPVCLFPPYEHPFFYPPLGNVLLFQMRLLQSFFFVILHQLDLQGWLFRFGQEANINLLSSGGWFKEKLKSSFILGRKQLDREGKSPVLQRNSAALLTIQLTCDESDRGRTQTSLVGDAIEIYCVSVGRSQVRDGDFTRISLSGQLSESAFSIFILN